MKYEKNIMNATMDAKNLISCFEHIFFLTSIYFFINAVVAVIYLLIAISR